MSLTWLGSLDDWHVDAAVHNLEDAGKTSLGNKGHDVVHVIQPHVGSSRGPTGPSFHHGLRRRKNIYLNIPGQLTETDVPLRAKPHVMIYK